MGQHSGFFSMGNSKYASFVVSAIGGGRWHVWIQLPGEKVSDFIAKDRHAAVTSLAMCRQFALCEREG